MSSGPYPHDDRGDAWSDVGTGPTAAGSTGGRADPETIRRLNKFAEVLDSQFQIPGTRFRMGIDGLIGLIPGIGDTATALLASYVILEAYRLNAPTPLILRMLANIGIDWAIGSIPLAGDVFDVAFKANKRNVAMLLRHLQDGPR